MSSKILIYVAGLLRGVRPMGLWSICMTLSICSSPVIFLYLSGWMVSLYTWRCSMGYRVSLMSVLLPEPETPDTPMNILSGNSAFTFLRLLPWQPVSLIVFSVQGLLCAGISILIFSAKYCAVMVSDNRNSWSVPWATISPPCTPALGPISMR